MSFLKWEPIRYDQGLKYIPDIDQTLNQEIEILDTTIKANRDSYQSAYGTINQLMTLWKSTAKIKYDDDPLYYKVQYRNLLLSLCKNMKELKV